MISAVTVVRCKDPLTDSWSTLAADSELVPLTYERLGIDNARELQRLAYSTPSQAAHQVLVVRTRDITLEAQNALLKLLEEPPATTQCVFLVPVTATLLPTLLSRVIEERLVSAAPVSVSAQWTELASASMAERLKLIDTKLKAKDTNWLAAIQQSLVAWIGQGQTVTPSIQLVSERLNTRGASNKMLLELLALELPTD